MYVSKIKLYNMLWLWKDLVPFQIYSILNA